MDLKNKVAELVRDKVIDGISDYHTDLKDGVKITITLKRDANPQVILNNLYKHTNFQIQYGIIFLMIDGMTPRTLGLKDIISKYIDHQKEVIIRRTKFDLVKAEKRVHILEGYKIAQDNIDEVIKIIKTAKIYYTFSYQNMIERMQSLINDLDFNKVNSLLDQFSSMFEQENDETMTMINELKEFKNIVNKQ